MIQFPPENSFCRISENLLSGNRKVGVHAYLISGFLSWGRKYFRLKEGLLVKVKLLAEEKLVESLVRLKLLAEKKMDPSLVKMELLLEDRMAGSLVKLELLLEERMAGSLVKLDLKHVEEKNSPQFGSPMFPLQLISEG
jgi:hypothetical protein